MGLFDDALDAVSGVTDAASDAVSGVTDAAGDVVSGVTDAASDVGGFVQDHWKQIAVIGAATIVGVAVTVATGGAGAPFLVAAFAGGAASGATGYTLDRWLNDQPWKPGDFAKATLLSGGLAVATAGLGRGLAPVTDAIVPEVVASSLPEGVVTGVTNATSGAALGATTQVAENVVTGRPAFENAGQAAGTGAFTATIAGGVADSVGGGAEGSGSSSSGRGMAGAIDDLANGSTGSGDAAPTTLAGTTPTLDPTAPLALRPGPKAPLELGPGPEAPLELGPGPAPAGELGRAPTGELGAPEDLAAATRTPTVVDSAGESYTYRTPPPVAAGEEIRLPLDQLRSKQNYVMDGRGRYSETDTFGDTGNKQIPEVYWVDWATDASGNAAPGFWAVLDGNHRVMNAAAAGVDAPLVKVVSFVPKESIRATARVADTVPESQKFGAYHPVTNTPVAGTGRTIGGGSVAEAPAPAPAPAASGETEAERVQRLLDEAIAQRVAGLRRGPR